MEYKAFVNFYSKLRTVFHDRNYTVHFVSAGIISPKDVDDMYMLSDNDRAKSLLKNISASLQCGEKQGFYKMLEILQVHGNFSAQQLADDIKVFVRGEDPAVAEVVPNEGTYFTYHIALWERKFHGFCCKFIKHDVLILKRNRNLRNETMYSICMIDDQ